MRRAARTDANQQQVIDALRRVGCCVRDTSRVGMGFPDLVVGYKGHNYLIEVKDGAKPQSKRALTPDERAFFYEWRGQTAVVLGPEDAVQYITRRTPCRCGK